MKARIPYLNANQKREIQKEIYLEYRKIEAYERLKMAERCLKIMIFVLNRDYHFGKKRANEFYSSCGELLKKADSDEIFWEHIDKVVIDNLGIKELSRDYTEKGKAVR